MLFTNYEILPRLFKNFFPAFSILLNGIVILPPFCVFIHVCVGSHVCVHAYMFAGLCVPVCACMWKTEVNVEHLPQLLSTFVF